MDGLSVLAQFLCRVETVFDVTPRAFVPQPKVTSTVVDFIPRAVPLAPCRLDDLERVTAAAFGQRRKMLRQSLKALGTEPAEILGRHRHRTDRARGRAERGGILRARRRYAPARRRLMNSESPIRRSRRARSAIRIDCTWRTLSARSRLTMT